jgi:hypothetical protein
MRDTAAFLQGLKKPQKLQSKTVGASAEIRTQCLQNKSEEHYRYEARLVRV